MKQLNKNTNTSHTISPQIVYSMTGFLLLTTIISGIVLSSSSTHADTTASSSVSVTVNSSCTLSASGGGTYSATITPGTYGEITGSTLSTICNDPNGYAIYAVGFGNDSYDTPTNTQMIGTYGNIVTGTATTGNTSNWAMKVSQTTTGAPEIMNSFGSYHVIPEDYTQIAKYTSSTASSAATGASIDTKYQVYVASAQVAGTYTGKVKYTMVHPNDAAAPEVPLYMQDMTASDCTTTPKTVYDKRDGEAYTVAKLVDNKCWMLDNLRLDITNSTILNGLTTSNTHVDANSLTSLKSGNRSAGNQYASSGFVTWDSNNISNAFNQAKANADYKDTTTTSYGAGSGKIGVYYNYCAASAGSYCYDSGAGTGNAQYDLCPAGWRMPTGGGYQGSGVGDGEYFALGTALGLTFDEDWLGFTGTTYQTALSTPLSGYFYNGSANAQGGLGAFWSSTYYDGYSMYYLYVDSGYASPPNSVYRDYGSSLRCVRDDSYE